MKFKVFLRMCIKVPLHIFSVNFLTWIYTSPIKELNEKIAISWKPDLKKSIKFLYYFYYIFLYHIFCIYYKFFKQTGNVRKLFSLHFIVANGIRKSYSLSDVAVVVPTLDPNPNPAHQSAESARAVAIETVRVTVRVGERRNESDHILGHDHGHHLPPPGHAQHRGPALPHLQLSSVIKKRNKVDKVARPVLTNLLYSSATNQNLLSEGVLAAKGVAKQTL